MRISDWSSDVCSSDLEQEQPDRLQRLDCGVRKAPIEVIDEDYQAIYLGVLQEFSELLPEGMHLFRRIVLGDFAQKLVRTLSKRGDGLRRHILGALTDETSRGCAQILDRFGVRHHGGQRQDIRPDRTSTCWGTSGYISENLG